MTQLSDQLPEAKRDTFGLFMTPVTRYELDQHSQHKGDILHWIRTQKSIQTNAPPGVKM